MQAYGIDAHSRLGSGVHGIVRLGKNITSGECHALKYVEGSDSTEGAVLKELDHPNIVKLLDAFGPHKQRPEVLVFPLADLDLYKFMQTRKRLSVQVAACLTYQLVTALAYLHGKQVVHRDLKPSNLLVTIGDDCGVKLTLADFGHARRLPDAPRQRLAEKTCVSNGGMQPLHRPFEMTPGLCTPCYSAPESFLPQGAEAPYSCAVDVWAAGAIAFEMLIGEALVMPRGRWDWEVVAWWIGRLGHPPAGLYLGQRQSALIQQALYLGLAVKPLTAALAEVDVVLAAVQLVQATLNWEGQARPPAAVLLRDFQWLQQRSVGGSDADAPQDNQCANAGGGGGPSSLAQPQGQQQNNLCANEGNGGSSSLAAMRGERGQRGNDDCCEDVDERGKEWPEQGCQCSGHCYVAGHRYHGGCSCTWVVQGTQHCRECLCSVPMCTCGRLRGDLCFKHKNIFDQLPEHVKIVRDCRSMVDVLMPCDVVDFTGHCADWWDDPVATLIAAMLKEPKATTALRAGLGQPGEPYTTQILASVLEEMVGILDGAEHDAELTQLNRQGSRMSSPCGLLGSLLRCGSNSRAGSNQHLASSCSGLRAPRSHHAAILPLAPCPLPLAAMRGHVLLPSPAPAHRPPLAASPHHVARRRSLPRRCPNVDQARHCRGCRRRCRLWLWSRPSFTPQQLPPWQDLARLQAHPLLR